MSSRRRTSIADAAQNHGDSASGTDGDGALALAEAEAAEAEALEAEALAAAAEAAAVDARAEVLRVQGATGDPAAVAGSDDAAQPDKPAESAGEARFARGSRSRLRFPHVRRSVLAAAVAVLCVLGLSGSAALMLIQHRSAVQDRQRSDEFAAAASEGVAILMSLNFTTAKADVQRILDHTTGEFKTDFEAQADDFAKVAEESRVITVATVNAAAVESMTRERATVLIAVTTKVSNSASKEQPPRPWRFSVDVAEDEGRIKLAKVEFVP